MNHLLHHYYNSFYPFSTVAKYFTVTQLSDREFGYDNDRGFRRHLHYKTAAQWKTSIMDTVSTLKKIHIGSNGPLREFCIDIDIQDYKVDLANIDSTLHSYSDSLKGIGSSNVKKLIKGCTCMGPKGYCKSCFTFVESIMHAFDWILENFAPSLYCAKTTTWVVSGGGLHRFDNHPNMMCYSSSDRYYALKRIKRVIKENLKVIMETMEPMAMEVFGDKKYTPLFLPILDEVVTTRMNGLIAAMYIVHPKTGIICMPYDKGYGSDPNVWKVEKLMESKKMQKRVEKNVARFALKNKLK